MFDWDAVIVGGGPAGLTAGIYLSRAKRRTVLLDRDSYGGYIRNIELLENYPGFAGGIAGAKLASEMVKQAEKYGLQMELAEVTGLEVFSGTRWVGCSRGQGYTTNVIVLAGGSRHKKLGVPGEAEFEGKGVFSCAFCDGSHYADSVVAVCGGGDSGITEALYMSRIAAKVILLEALPELTAVAVLRDRAMAEKKLEIRCGTRVEAIRGNDKVEAIECLDTLKEKKETIQVDGVLVQIGLDPDTEYLRGAVPLDEQGFIVVDRNMQTEVTGVFAAGDIRSGSPRQVVTAVGDGAVAAIAAQKFLQETE
jgi:thioredoxin reductase (NADPH)